MNKMWFEARLLWWALFPSTTRHPLFFTHKWEVKYESYKRGYAAIKCIECHEERVIPL